MNKPTITYTITDTTDPDPNTRFIRADENADRLLNHVLDDMREVAKDCLALINGEHKGTLLLQAHYPHIKETRTLLIFDCFNHGNGDIWVTKRPGPDLANATGTFSRRK